MVSATTSMCPQVTIHTAPGSTIGSGVLAPVAWAEPCRAKSWERVSDMAGQAVPMSRA